MYDDIRKALRQLKATTPQNPPKKRLKSIVLSLSRDIRQAVAAGHSFEAVAKVLGDGGINIKPGTLREYLRIQAREAADAAASGTAPARREKPAPKKQAKKQPKPQAENAAAKPEEASAKPEEAVDELLDPVVTAESNEGGSAFVKDEF